MKKINTGSFNGKIYTKIVSFSKAVLWKDRQISLPVHICNRMLELGIETVIFIDRKKGEQWEASVDDLRKSKILKKEGQEPQFYFPIEIFKIKKI